MHSKAEHPESRVVSLNLLQAVLYFPLCSYRHQRLQSRIDLIGNGFHALTGSGDSQLGPFVSRETLVVQLLEGCFVLQQRPQASVSANSLFGETTLPQFL